MGRKIVTAGLSLAGAGTLVLALAVWAGWSTTYRWWIRGSDGEHTQSWYMCLADNVAWISHIEMKCACHGMRTCPNPGPTELTLTGFGGFYLTQGRSDHPEEGWPSTTSKGLRTPVWFLPVAFSAYPVFVAIRGAMVRRRREAPLCLECGYNLTGLPENRCPECGTPFESPASSKVRPPDPQIPHTSDELARA